MNSFISGVNSVLYTKRIYTKSFDINKTDNVVTVKSDNIDNFYSIKNVVELSKEHIDIFYIIVTDRMYLTEDDIEKIKRYGIEKNIKFVLFSKLYNKSSVYDKPVHYTRGILSVLFDTIYKIEDNNNVVVIKNREGVYNDNSR